ncbi:MAG: ankyrin repeat domain-containing protein, partial [Cyclobacteriaceae bacterium]
MKSRRKFLKTVAIVGTVLSSTPIYLLGAPQNKIQLKSDIIKFLAACESGDHRVVKALLLEDKSLMIAKDKLGRSGYALALLAGHSGIGELLKNSGYKPDIHESALGLDWDRYDELVGEESEATIKLINSNHPIGGTVMWAAAAGGAGIDIWRIYAKCGDPNAAPRKENGSTPLQRALRFSDLATAEQTSGAILSNNAEVDPANNADLPPLHIASERGSYLMVEMLIRLGADINRKDQNGLLATQLAEKNGHMDVFKLLMNHKSIPKTCRTSRMALNADGLKYEAPDISDIPLYLRRRLVGQSHGNLDYVKKTVTADPRMAHSVATTSEICVEACAHIGRKPIVEYLLKHGAPYSLPTAVMMNDFTTVKRLLNEDPMRIEERGAHDFGLLWYPIIGECDVDMAQLLIDRGANVEHQHFMGTTALHWACQRNRMDMVELLVENGADINRVGRKFKAEGQTPLQSTGNQTILKYLKSRGAV